MGARTDRLKKGWHSDKPARRRHWTVYSRTKHQTVYQPNREWRKQEAAQTSKKGEEPKAVGLKRATVSASMQTFSGTCFVKRLQEIQRTFVLTAYPHISIVKQALVNSLHNCCLTPFSIQQVPRDLLAVELRNITRWKLARRETAAYTAR